MIRLFAVLCISLCFLSFSAWAQNFPLLSEEARLQRLTPPQEGKVRMVLDTDTYNEIDDQFALVYTLLSPERLDLEAVYAAPFLNNRSESAKDGMEKSYEEILRILDKMNVPADGFVFKGSERFLQKIDQPEESEAVDDMIRRAMQSSAEDPLYVVAVGAITNVASAILKQPEIIENIVVIWLGGDAPMWSNRPEFNLQQDVLSASVLMDSGVPFVQVPCLPVASHLMTTRPEMEAYVRGKGEIGNYLYEIFEDYSGGKYAYSKVIWDMAAVAYLLNPRWTQTETIHSPILSVDRVTWGFDNSRHFIGMVKSLNRDAIFGDFFRKLEE
ncbi:MAG: nucleoside hydrolase [Cyclobacteriaceae bacterium]